MAAALLAGTLALHKHNQMNDSEAGLALTSADRLYSVTMAPGDVLPENATFWTHRTFLDDRLWAVRFSLSPAIAFEQQCVIDHFASMLSLPGLELGNT